jgi:hypothetical protein
LELKISKNSLCEVFGFPISNLSNKAVHYRKNKLCPYNTISANSTKDKAQDPLGVCSIYDSKRVAITCPVRFSQDWIIATNSASLTSTSAFFHLNVILSYAQDLKSSLFK